MTQESGEDMTNKEILQVAMRQSAIDSSCSAEDFLKEENMVVFSRKNAAARRYLELPFYCDLTSYGANIVASVTDELASTVGEYINKYQVEHCFETPNLHVLIEALKPYDLNVCFMAEYFLPDMALLNSHECGYAIKLLQPEDFSGYYLPEWGNALCDKRRDLDVLAAGAFDGDMLVGLAGCSADCESMWQIGVDVLPTYRKQGVASCLTGFLAREVLKRNIVPFYCCAWSNIKSARNAIKSGFKPAWVQATVKSNSFIADMNR